MDLNYFGTLHPIRAVLGSMLERGTRHDRRDLVGRRAGRRVRVRRLRAVEVRGARADGHAAGRGRGARASSSACAFPPDTLTPGFETENLIKPPETAAVSAGIKPKLAEEIGAGLVRGIERDRHVITFDPQTALLARGGGLVAPDRRTG